MKECGGECSEERSAIGGGGGEGVLERGRKRDRERL